MFAVILLTVLMLLSSTVPAHALLWWRDSISSVRPEKPPRIDGSDQDWNVFDEYESDGLSLRAMNDETNLYLLVEGRGKEGLAELSGQYQKDLTFWFVSTDTKKRMWGLRFPFSRHSGRGDADTRPAGPPGEQPMPDEKVRPLFVEMSGNDEVDAALASDIVFAATLSGRRSIFEMSLPIARLPLKGKRTVLLDIDRDAPSPAALRAAAPSQAHSRPGGEDPDEGGGMGGSMRGAMSGSGMPEGAGGQSGMGGRMGGGPGGGMSGGPGGRPGPGGPGSMGPPEIEAISMRLKVLLAP